MSSTHRADIETELKRIAIRPGDRLPLPRGLEDELDYLTFLRQVPDGSGVSGFTATMAQLPKHQ
jgi:hypothetical protein